MRTIKVNKNYMKGAKFEVEVKVTGNYFCYYCGVVDNHKEVNCPDRIQL